MLANFGYQSRTNCTRTAQYMYCTEQTRKKSTGKQPEREREKKEIKKEGESSGSRDRSREECWCAVQCITVAEDDEQHEVDEVERAPAVDARHAGRVDVDAVVHHFVPVLASQDLSTAQQQHEHWPTRLLILLFLLHLRNETNTRPLLYASQRSELMKCARMLLRH